MRWTHNLPFFDRQQRHGNHPSTNGGGSSELPSFAERGAVPPPFYESHDHTRFHESTTFANMPFKPDFERRVNDNLREGEAGPVPPSPSPSGTTMCDDSDIKKRACSPPFSKGKEKEDSVYEAEDIDMSYKQQKSLPPRFSTIFDTGSKPDPPPQPQIVECCHRQTRKKGGVTLSIPVFILLVIALLFMSTLLFAYTVIGLYQNTPAAFWGVVGAPAPVDGCHCEATPAAAAEEAGRQGTINFAPNFIFGQGGEKGDSLPLPQSVTVHETDTDTTTATSASPTTLTDTDTETKTTPTTESASKTTDAAQVAASQVLGILQGQDRKPTSSSSSPSLWTTVQTSVSMVTATPGHTQSAVTTVSVSESPTTVTSVHFVDGPDTSTMTTVTEESPAKRTPVVTSAPAPAPAPAPPVGDHGDGADGAVLPPESSTTSTTAMDDGPKHTAGPCFGAGGAAMQICPDLQPSA